MKTEPLNLYFPETGVRRGRVTKSSDRSLLHAERGAWIAAGICVVVLGVLRLPVHGTRLDVTLMYAVNAAMSRLPLIGYQTAILNEDIAQVIIGVAAVAIWFRRPVDTRLRTRLLIALFAFFPTYALARIIQHSVDRPRPMIDHTINILGNPATFHDTKFNLTHWGSFPSDHSAMLAIATIVAFMVGRRIGIITLVLAAYSCIFRVAYGYHWPIDIAGGALLGTVTYLVVLACRRYFRPLIDGIFAFTENRPAFAAAIGALIVIEFSESFHYLKVFVSLVLHSRLFH
jgi:membrane-associated phospholipid phosphatase